MQKDLLRLLCGCWVTYLEKAWGLLARSIRSLNTVTLNLTSVIRIKSLLSSWQALVPFLISHAPNLTSHLIAAILWLPAMQ